MKAVFPCATEANLLSFVEACLAASNLDDLFELVLGHLLDVNCIRRVEISLFNKKNDPVLVAEGEKSNQMGSSKHRISLQSWIIHSAVRHSTRRVKMPSFFLETSLPLRSSEGLIGYLKIQQDTIQTADHTFSTHLNLLVGYLSIKIKEILLRDEIGEMTNEIKRVSSDNADNQRRITSLSKELYAICATSTKINRSMDIKKSLRKSIAKLQEVFKTSAVLVYLKKPGRSKPELFASHGKDPKPHFAHGFIERLETLYIPDFFSDLAAKENRFSPTIYCPRTVLLNHEEYRSMVLAPLRAKKKLIGTLVLLYRSAGTFNQDNLRLLSGIGDIMGMATENMNLYRQSQQKKKTSAFLVQSISRFNEKLDLEKTLKTITGKGAEFIGKGCGVYLFTETKIPMIHLGSLSRRDKTASKPEAFKQIEPAALRDFYEQMRHNKRPSLVSDIVHTREYKRNVRSFFEQEGIKSLVSVPLTLVGKSMGLLLFCRGGRGKRTFDPLDLSVAEALGAAASVAIENARVYTASVEMSDFLEKKIVEKNEQIHEIQKRLNYRVENRNDIIFRVNARNRFIFVNKAMETMTGLGREEIYREDFNVGQVVAPEDRERVANCFQIILEGALPVVKDLVYRHMNRRGQDHTISLTIFPETDANGSIIGIEGVGRDISDTKRLEAELAKAKDLALLGEFSSAIAHQIRNPLGNILMGSKLLQRSLGLGFPSLADRRAEGMSAMPLPTDFNREALVDIFRNLSDGITNLNEVVTKLVEYTKTLKLCCSYQSIPILLEENMAMSDDSIAEKRIHVETYFENNLPCLSVDAVLIGQVFQNIIHNAIQAMRDGGRLVVSARTYSEKSAYVLISISDTGEGIAPSEVEKIFHPFFTTKDSGTGLGLSLAFRIIEAHKGKIWVCNNPCAHAPLNGDGSRESFVPLDKGVTFHISLPLNARKKRHFHNKVIA